MTANAAATQLGAVLAASNGSTLARSLLLAALIVAPYAWYKRRQVRRVRAECAAQIAASQPSDPTPEPTLPPLEAIIEQIHSVALAGAAHTHDANPARDAPPTAGATGDRVGVDSAFTITIPRRVTVDASEISQSIADTLIRDALRRSGLAVVAEVDTADGRLIECRRLASQ